MIIREATLADTAHIVQLLKLSLGDVSTEKSTAYWRWKHIDNPFGPSHVLLAEQDGLMTGVRAFMQWRWTDGQREFTALRAVDTATHPDYRGQGIFKKLTLALIERRREAGDDFIFNTPNAQSKPGYLKMGWREVGRLPVSLRIRRPIALLKNKVAEPPPIDLPIVSTKMDWAATYDLGAGPQVGRWSTALRAGFLRWRYRDCPVVEYTAVGVPERYVLVVHPKVGAYGLELRIVESRVAPPYAAEARAALNRLIRQYRPVYVTAAPGGVLATGLGWVRLSVGPTLTYRALTFDQPPLLKDWRYALGDMELF